MNNYKLNGFIEARLHRAKRLSQRLGIKISRILDPDISSSERIGESERDAAMIFRKMLKLDESELLMSPISQKKYVKNDAAQILLILDSYELTVINHIFSYNIRMSSKNVKSLSDAFNTEIEKRRLEMEESFRENVKHSLKTIMVKIDE